MGTFSSRALRYVFTGATVGLTLLACGDDDEAVPPPGPPTDATIQGISETFCQKFVECAGDILIRVGYGTNETCATRVKAQLKLDLLSNGYGVTDPTASSCLTAAKSAACGDILNNKVPEACRFKGTLADGANCTNDGQCQSGSCFFDPKATCGKCGPRAGEGADCTNAQCDFGLRCNGSKICTNGAVGAACSKDDDCQALTYCRNSVCTAPLEEGAACVVQAKDGDPPCNVVKGLFCFPEAVANPNGTCKKVELSFVGNGEKCGFTSLLPPRVVGCTNGDCINDVCVAHLADGAPCTDANNQPKCQEPAKCRAGTCSLKDPAVCK